MRFHQASMREPFWCRRSFKRDHEHQKYHWYLVRLVNRIDCVNIEVALGCFRLTLGIVDTVRNSPQTVADDIFLLSTVDYGPTRLMRLV